MKNNTNSITAIGARAIAYPARIAQTETFVAAAMRSVFSHIRDAAASGALNCLVILGEDGCPKYGVSRSCGVDYTRAASEINLQLTALGFDISGTTNGALHVSWA